MPLQDESRYQPDLIKDNTKPNSTGRSDAHAMPHATSSTRVGGSALASQTNQDRPLVSRSGPMPAGSSVRNISSEFGALRAYSSFSIAEDGAGSNVSSSPQQPWTSAVGTANQGKSGRVIERLTADNDMLKRELQIMRLAVDQAQSDVKMAEGRMEAQSSEYEARLHGAQVTEALLLRRDRQVADLKGQIDGERQKANAAVESERNWRAAFERMESETKIKVEEATNYAHLMEGRYNAITSHWKDQGADVEAIVLRMKEEISALSEQRYQECKKYELLQDLCDQHDSEKARLIKHIEAIMATFEAYKAEQEQALKDIKARAQKQQKDNEHLDMETKRLQGELRWALAVQRDLRPDK